MNKKQNNNTPTYHYEFQNNHELLIIPTKVFNLVVRAPCLNY